MTIRYRRLDSNNDYSFGRGQGDFVTGIEAVAQACVTRLRLWKETFWRDLEDGTPYMQDIIATNGSIQNLRAISDIIQGRIAGTPDVLAVDNVFVQYFPDTRRLIFNGNVTTAYSTVTLSMEVS